MASVGLHRPFVDDTHTSPVGTASVAVSAGGIPFRYRVAMQTMGNGVVDIDIPFDEVEEILKLLRELRDTGVAIGGDGSGGS